MKNLVQDEIKTLLKNTETMQGYLADFPLKKQKELLKTAENVQPDNNFIRTVLFKATIYKDKVEVMLCKDTLVKSIEALTYNTALPQAPESPDNTINISKKIKISQTNNGAKLIVRTADSQPEHNHALVQAVVKSFYYSKLIAEGTPPPELKTSSYARRIAKLIFLPPKLIENILNGTQERDLTVVKLFKMTSATK